jgi:hypothetical protein
MKKVFGLLVCCILFSSFSSSESSRKTLFDPDPLIFQTWYLYSTSVDQGDPNYYYGADVPQMTIFPDFSFTAIDNCWAISGNFEYTEEGIHLDFGLITLNYTKDCILGGSTGYVLELIYEVTDTVNCLIWGDIGNSELIIETYAYFNHHFKNTITLSVPEQQLQKSYITPNPVSDIFSINTSNPDIDSILIYTIDGVLVKDVITLDEIRIDISEFSTGIYFAKIISGNHSVVKKIIKE